MCIIPTTSREMNILVLASYNTRAIMIHDFENSSKMGVLARISATVEHGESVSST